MELVCVPVQGPVLPNVYTAFRKCTAGCTREWGTVGESPCAHCEWYTEVKSQVVAVLPYWAEQF